MINEKLNFEIGKTIWPGISNRGGNAPPEKQAQIRELITELSQYIALALEENSISRFAFILFRPFNAVFAITSQNLLVIVSPLSGGIAALRYMDWKDAEEISMEQAVGTVRQQLGWTNISSFQLPIKFLDQTSLERKQELENIALDFVERIKTQILHEQQKIRFQPIFRASLDELEVENDLCFVLIPFKAEFNRIYEDVIQQAINEAGLKPLRADKIFSSTPIVEDIWTHIAKSKVIIADVTDKNPNVFYELGLAHAIGKPVIIIAQNKEDIPFDIAYIRYFLYTDDDRGWKKLKKDLENALSSIIATSQ
jgi:hypothetical protein